MTTNTETIIDQDGIEFIVTYTTGEDDYEESPYKWKEVYVILDEVEIVIKGSSISILPFLNTEQQDVIISALPIH